MKRSRLWVWSKVKEVREQVEIIPPLLWEKMTQAIQQALVSVSTAGDLKVQLKILA